MVLIYRDVLVLLKATPSPRLGSASESTEYHAVVDGYMTSMSSDNIATAVVQSLSCRRTLLELSAKLGVEDDDGLRVALHTGDERIAELLQSIFKSGKAEATMLKLKGDAAQDFLDVVQATLDRGLLVAEDDIRRARRMILKLSESSEKLPSGVFITGVTRRGPDPTFGGGYCDVYLGSHGDQMVAVKHIRQFLRGAELRRLRKRFYREALLWKDLRHPNILSFLGIDRASFPSSLCMVSPWMKNGTVLKYLKEHGRARIGELLYHIARGLRYLHAHNIIHGDLRGTNILITADWKACLADFGLSTLSDITASTTTTRRGSSYWMAPELLDPDSFGLKFARTRATDVYAFGCVCIELYTGQAPFSPMSEGAALLKVVRGQRPRQPAAMSNALWRKIQTYWAQQPAVRPPTDSIVLALHELRVFPPNPDHVRSEEATGGRQTSQHTSASVTPGISFRVVRVVRVVRGDYGREQWEWD